MRVKYTTANQRLTVEFEAESDKKLVQQLAHFQEVFEEPACGCCKSTNIRYEVREFEHLHYKLLCVDCGATIDFGQNKVGEALFLKRFEKDTREPLPNKGWYIYKDKDGGKASPKPEPAPAANRSTPKPAPVVPAQKAPPPAHPPEKSTHEAHEETLTNMAKSLTMDYRNRLVKWRKQWPLSKQEAQELEDALHAPLAVAKTRQPTLAGVGDDIPF